MKPKLTQKEKETLLPHLAGWPDLSYKGWRTMILEANKRIRKVSSEQNVQLIDLEYSIDSQYFKDICHLDDKGNELLAHLIANEIKPLIQQ